MNWTSKLKIEASTLAAFEEQLHAAVKAKAEEGVRIGAVTYTAEITFTRAG